jgi:calcineurin-like phosphoesterase family protein
VIDRLEWLHVSDFHFVADGDVFSQQVAARALLDDVTQRVSGGKDIAFVLVTGDVAFSGRRDEYEKARAFFSEFASAVDVPPERFYFVPGNHDVERRRNKLAYKGACSDLTSQSAVDLLLGDAEDLSPLIERQEEFRAFVNAFTGPQDRTETADGLGYVAPLVVGGLSLCLMGLNSAWLSGRDAEEMQLVLGERQVINALEVASRFSAQLRIAMAHHPFGWLKEWDRSSCHQRLLPAVNFYFRGHLHRAEVITLSSSPDRPCLSVAAGSGHVTRFYANSYNFVELDLGAGVCTVRPFRYDPDAGQYGSQEDVQASIFLQGSLPGGRDELRKVLEEASLNVRPYAGYLADLIVAQKEEVPVRLGNTIEFLTPTIAAAMGSEALTAVTNFLRLRNVLRLYDEEVPLPDRIEEQASVVEDFVGYLSPLAAEDVHCAERITAGRDQEGGSPLHYTAEFLADLRGRGDWALLESQASRFQDSSDKTLGRFARAALAEALIHSDENQKREQAARLALELAMDPEASPAESLLAAACAEVIGDDNRAIEVAIQALLKWPSELTVKRYAQKLALRAGSSKLRAAVEEAERGMQTS